MNDIEMLLRKYKAPQVVIDIAAGKNRPPLSDYHLKPLHEGMGEPLPKELTNGNIIIPIFSDQDLTTVYGINETLGEVCEFELHDPWPPLHVYSDCSEFGEDFIRMIGELDQGKGLVVKELFRDK